MIREGSKSPVGKWGGGASEARHQSQNRKSAQRSTLHPSCGKLSLALSRSRKGYIYIYRTERRQQGTRLRRDWEGDGTFG